MTGERRARHDRLDRTRRLRTRVHPVAWIGPVAGSAVAMLAWLGVTRSSGSGWVQAVGALLAAVLLTGLVAPLLPAARARVTCVANDADAVAGRTATLNVRASGPVRLRPLAPGGPVRAATGALRGPRDVELDLLAGRRGVLESVVLEVGSSAPFGLLWWAKEVRVDLVRPLHVAPRTGAPDPAAPSASATDGEAPATSSAPSGEPRGVRPYEHGDTRRAVHWPSTAHAGELMVRERERHHDHTVVLDVALPADPLEAEAEAERAMATASGWLVAGRTVLLGTDETSGAVRRVVHDHVDLGRRLARAVPAGPRGKVS